MEMERVMQLETVFVNLAFPISIAILVKRIIMALIATHVCKISLFPFIFNFNYFKDCTPHETCYGNGTCSGSGDCICKNGFAPPYCDRCTPSHFGANCETGTFIYL